MSGYVKDENHTSELLDIIEQLENTEVRIGVFGEDDSTMVMIAAANEFGAHIVPKRAKALAIPVKHDYINQNGKLVKAGSVLMVKAVNIPERSFIRAGFDANVDRIEKLAESLLPSVFRGDLKPQAFYERLGSYTAGLIQMYSIKLRTPPNAAVTIANKQSNNPLVDTGRLQQAITWKVVAR